MPKLANSSFQDLEVKFASLSDIIFFGTLCGLIISLMKTYSTSPDEYVVFIGMK